MARKLMLEVAVDDKGNVVLQKLQDNVGKLDKRTKGLGNTLTKVFASAVLISVLNKFRQAIGEANKEVMNFNLTFKQVEGVTGTSGKALADLKAKTIEVSNATEHASSSIAKAVLNISKMGFTTKQSLEIIPSVADLATASMVDLDEAARVSVQTMKSFNMQAKDMDHITNVIQGTVSKTAANFDEYSEALKFVAPISNTLGITLEETSAMIGKLADVGIKGSIAGTTLKNMFLNIMKPSDDVKKVLQELGVEGKDFNTILKALNDNDIPVSSFLESFNKRAIAGSLALSKMTGKTEELTKLLEENGVQVSDVASKIREAWVPQLKMLSNTFVNTFVVIGDILDESDLGLGIKGITDRLIEFQKYLKDNPGLVINAAKEITEFIKVLTKLGTETFGFVLKNGNLILKMFQGMLALNLASKFLSIGNSINTWVTATGTAGKALTSFNPILLILVSAIETANWWVDKFVAKLDKMTATISDTTASGLEHQIEALEMWKKRYSDVILELEDRQLASIDRGYSGVAAEMQIKDMMDRAKSIAKEISKQTNIPAEFFLNIDPHDVDRHISGLMKRVNVLKKQALTEEEAPEAPEAFNIEDLLGDEIGKAEEKGKESAFAYWDAALEIQKQMGAAFGIGASEDLVGEAFRPSLQGMGLNTGGVKTSTPGLGAGAVEPTSLSTPVSPIGTMTTDPLELQVGIQKQIDALESYNETWAETNEKVGSFKEKMSETLSETQQAQQEFNIEQSEMWDQHLQEQIDGMVQAAQMGIDIIQMIQDNQFEKMKARHKEELRMLDERSRKELAHVQGNAFKQAIVAQKLAKEKKKLEAQQMKEEKAQKEKQRKWAMIEVGINTAVGVTQALRGMTPPASIIMAAIVAAMGLAQLAVISSQEGFRKGGFTGYGNPAEVAGTVHKQEFVVPNEDVRALGGEVGVRQMIEDRLQGGATAKVVNVTIESFIGTEEYERGLFVRLQKEAQRWQ